MAGALESGPGLIAVNASDTTALAPTSHNTSPQRRPGRRPSGNNSSTGTISTICMLSIWATQANQAAPGRREPGDASPMALAYSDANISAAKIRPQAQHNQPITFPLREAISAPIVAS